MPGSGFKIKHLRTHTLLQRMLDTQYNIVKKALVGHFLPEIPFMR